MSEQQELEAKIKSLDLKDETQRNDVVCALIGHSKIVEFCFGYVYCGRCGAQIGDTLGGYFDTSSHVIVGHNCDTCRDNYKKLSWKDTLYCKDPFAEPKEEAAP